MSEYVLAAAPLAISLASASAAPATALAERARSPTSLAATRTSSAAALPSAATSWQLAIGLLSVLSVGYLTGVALFWSIPTAYFSTRAAAGSIALISSLGQLGGLTAPNIIGWTQQVTGSSAAGFYTIAIGMVIGTGIMMVGMPARLLRGRHIDR